MNVVEDIKNALYDSYRMTADMVVTYIGDDEALFRIVFDISFSDPYPMNMRAARVCQICCERNYKMILPYLDELPGKIAQCKAVGVKRSFLKIYADHLPYKYFAAIDVLLQVCFDLMMNQKESIAVRAYSMEIAFKLCMIEPDLIVELKEIARFELDSPSAGMQSKAIQIISKLKKLQSKNTLPLI